MQKKSKNRGNKKVGRNAGMFRKKKKKKILKEKFLTLLENKCKFLFIKPVEA